MPAASRPAPAPVASTREPIAVAHLRQELRTALRQLDALVGEVRRLQGELDALMQGNT